MKKFRFYLAMGIRLVGFIWKFPATIMYSLSDIIKNKEDEFDF